VSPFLELAAVLAAIVAAAKLGGYAAARVGLPMVVGEITVGLLLGPTALNLLHLPLFTHAEATGEAVHLLAELGVLLLMFLAGLETDLDAMKKVGGPALAVAIGGVLLPFAGGWAVGAAFGLPLAGAIFLGTILTATSVSISAQTLIELGRLRSKEGMTILGAAVIDDVIGILMLAAVVAVFATGGGTPPPVWLVAVKMTAYFVVAMLLAPVARAVLRFFSRLPVSEPLLAGALVIAIVYGVTAEVLGGVAAITGAYLAGIILSQGEHRSNLEHRLTALVYGLLVPVFFVDIGLRADLGSALGGGQLGLAGLVLLVAIVGKIVGAAIGALLSRFSAAEAARVGTGMVSRGEVGLIVAGIGVDRGVIDGNLFSIMVLMVVVTTLVTPVLLRLTFAPDRPSGGLAPEQP
jgi:Kef-type K+ transport system membrane component KefB